VPWTSKASGRIAFSVAPWGIDTQTFSIVDPESAPEPGAALLMLTGLVFLVRFFSRRLRYA